MDKCVQIVLSQNGMVCACGSKLHEPIRDLVYEVRQSRGYDIVVFDVLEQIGFDVAQKVALDVRWERTQRVDIFVLAMTRYS